MQTMEIRPMYTGNLASPEARRELMITRLQVRPVSRKKLSRMTCAPIIIIVSLSVNSPNSGTRNAMTITSITTVTSRAHFTLVNTRL
ncbi:hypothetical protein D3C71_2062850 [compost metagenome]